MKHALLTASLVLALSPALALAQSTAPAQDAPTAPTSTPHHRHNPQREAARLSQQLNLSADQTAKLEPILADRDQKLSALESDTTLTPQQVKQQRRAIQKDTQQQLSTVLTPDQLQQMRALHHHAAPSQAEPLPTPPSGN
jgi:protein CpxP